nr:MAG TPA: hypothetical protein [Caudoviricetes sp.]
MMITICATNSGEQGAQKSEQCIGRGWRGNRWGWGCRSHLRHSPHL